MSAMISLNKLQSSERFGMNQNVNVNVNTRETEVKYPEHLPDDETEQLKREIQALKIIIDIQRSNPLIINKYIIADDEKLLKLIQLLTNADDVQLDAEDIGSGCSGKAYRKVNSIYVIKGEETLNLKYDCARVVKQLSDLGISCKFVW